MRATVALCLLALLPAVLAMVPLPGLEARVYRKGNPIPLLVNKLTSPRTQLPYSYYSLPFCEPAKIEDARENLGEMLIGDRLETSAYNITAVEDVECQVVCKITRSAGAKDLRKMKARIAQEYRVHWLLDMLPAATKTRIMDSKGGQRVIYERGFPLGSVDGDEVFINNHLSIVVLYHELPEANDGSFNIVGVLVVPASVRQDHTKGPEHWKEACTRRAHSQLLDITQETHIVYTYSVHWEKSPVEWSSRWDLYMGMGDSQSIHWFSILNSSMIVLFLTGMVALIMIRTLRSDLKRYSMQTIESDDQQEETGWKLVHADVLRPPRFRALLCSLLGAGVQLTGAFLSLMLFAMAGFLTPANRGALLTSIPVLFVLMGIFAGYASALTYKIMGGQDWKRNTLMTATFFPGIVFGIALFLNFFLLGERSSGAVGFGTLFSLAGLWFGISIPLILIGSYFGYNKQLSDPPNKPTLIPRLIPEQVWYMRPVSAVAMGGLLPFGVVFIELFFILSSIWQQQIYYLWLFLFLAFVILTITCAEIAIVMCYFQLCSEDYHWWWRSFLTSGASAGYMFIYAIFYYRTRLNIIGFVSKLLYFGYSLLMSLCFFVVTGSIGFFACLWFVRFIYRSVHLS